MSVYDEMQKNIEELKEASAQMMIDVNRMNNRIKEVRKIFDEIKELTKCAKQK